MMGSSKFSGFALIEAIVAIVVLSSALLAVYGWLNVSITMLAKTDDVLTQELIISKLLRTLTHEDLREYADGQLEFENLVFEWRASLVEPIRDGNNILGVQSLYDHGLYRVDITVLKRTQLVDSYRVNIVNSKRVRDPAVDF